MKKILLCLMLTGAYALGQVKIGSTDQPIHPRAMVAVENNKGILLPSVNQTNQLPLYQESLNEQFSGDLTMSGMVMYNKEEKDVYRFDGYEWSSASRSSKLTKKISRFSAKGSDVVQVIVLGITAKSAPIPFSFNKSLVNKELNNLNLTIDNGTIEFKEDGLYRINPSLFFKAAGGLSVGNAQSKVYIEKYFKEDGENRFWKVAMNSYTMAGLVVTVGEEGANNFEYTSYFKAGDKIQIRFAVSSTGLGVGVGLTQATQHPDTYLLIEKLN